MDFLESAAVLIPVLTGMALTVYRGEPDTLGQFEAQYCFSAQLQNIYTAQGLGAFCQKGAEDRIYDLEEPMGTRLAADSGCCWDLMWRRDGACRPPGFCSLGRVRRNPPCRCTKRTVVSCS